MSKFEVYDADVHDFDIRHSLIDIQYLYKKAEFYPVSCIKFKTYGFINSQADRYVPSASTYSKNSL
jgi:hypothetical protein